MKPHKYAPKFIVNSKGDRLLEVAKKRRIITVILMLIISVVLSVSVTYAAFMSAGHRKGVAVSNGYYFTSNVLSKMESEQSAPGSYLCVCNSNVTNLNVKIMNHDSKLIPDPFSVTYDLKFSLHNPGANYENFTYSLTYEDTTYPIGTTQTVISGITFADSELDTTDFTVTFSKVNADALPSDASAVRIIAVPTAPIAITQYVIGSDVSLSIGNVGFMADGNFDVSSGGLDDLGELDDLGGFLFHVSTSGNVPNGKTGFVTLTWNANELELDQQNEYLIDTTKATYTPPDTTTHMASLAIKVLSGEYLSLAFFRASTWTGVFNPTSNPSSNDYAPYFQMSSSTEDIIN